MHLWSRCLLFQSLEIVKLGQFKYNSFSSKLFLFMTTGLNCSQMWRSKLFRSKQIYHLVPMGKGCNARFISGRDRASCPIIPNGKSINPFLDHNSLETFRPCKFFRSSKSNSEPFFALPLNWYCLVCVRRRDKRSPEREMLWNNKQKSFWSTYG